MIWFLENVHIRNNIDNTIVEITLNYFLKNAWLCRGIYNVIEKNTVRNTILKQPD